MLSNDELVQTTSSLFTLSLQTSGDCLNCVSLHSRLRRGCIMQFCRQF